MRTLITTEDLPVAERFAYFRDVVFREPSPMAVHCDRPTDFSAQLDKADLLPARHSALVQAADAGTAGGAG